MEFTHVKFSNNGKLLMVVTNQSLVLILDAFDGNKVMLTRECVCTFDETSSNDLFVLASSEKSRTIAMLRDWIWRLASRRIVDMCWWAPTTHLFVCLT